MNVLIVLTSHDQLGDSGHKTGFWLEEFASPYYCLVDAGASITLASPLASTVKLSAMKVDNFDAVFYPGGHGPLWDLHKDSDSIALIEAFIGAGKPVASVCHAPAVLLKAKAANGDPLVMGKKVTGFSNSEEAAVELTDVVPYLLEDELVAMGGLYQKVDDWNPLAVVDGLLITGQNPGSSAAVAEALVKIVKQLQAQ